MVHKGDTLVVLDGSEFALKLQQSQDALLQAEGQLELLTQVFLKLVQLLE